METELLKRLVDKSLTREELLERVRQNFDLVPVLLARVNSFKRSVCMKSGQSILITGGAGFIGSHLVDALTKMEKDCSIHVFDNLTSGTLRNVRQHLQKPNFSFVKGDLLKPSDINKLEHNHYPVVYHLAANPEVKVGSIHPNIHFQQNIVTTYNLLEHLRKNENSSTIVFASTSTVYGDASQFPTPETYSPLTPISVYGATKLACEALITAYSHTYGFDAVIYRLANIIGPRSEHGVIYDFIQKLKKNAKKLEILGDGTQTKSYLYVTDCIEAMLLGLERPTRRVQVYNLGSDDQINVKTIAQIIIEEMGLKNVKLCFTGGVDGGRGWKGDVKKMLLDIGKIKSLGWEPKLNSRQAIKATVRASIQNRSEK